MCKHLTRWIIQWSPRVGVRNKDRMTRYKMRIRVSAGGSESRRRDLDRSRGKRKRSGSRTKSRIRRRNLIPWSLDLRIATSDSRTVSETRGNILCFSTDRTRCQRLPIQLSPKSLGFCLGEETLVRRSHHVPLGIDIIFGFSVRVVGPLCSTWRLLFKKNLVCIFVSCCDCFVSYFLLGPSSFCRFYVS